MREVIRDWLLNHFEEQMMSMPSVSFGGILELALYVSTYMLGIIYLVHWLYSTENGRDFINKYF